MGSTAAQPHWGRTREAESELSELSPTEVETRVLERRRQLLTVREHGLNERAAQLDQREIEVEERQAAFDFNVAEHEIAIAIERDALTGRAKELAELADRLARKEAQVASYVTQAQKHLVAAAARPPRLESQRKRGSRIGKRDDH